MSPENSPLCSNSGLATRCQHSSTMTTFTIEFSKRWSAVPTLMPAAPAIVCQSSIGSSTEVADVDAAAAELTAKGHHLIHGARAPSRGVRSLRGC